MGRLIIVSNRLPVSIKTVDGETKFKGSVGGLATGLSSFYNDYKALWIGYPGAKIDSGVEKRLIDEFRCYPVNIPKPTFDLYYNGFSNKTMWPLLHSFPMYTTYSQDYWNAYKRVNRLFMGALSKIAKNGDTIWVHDYHLGLLPDMIRKRYNDAKVGFFLHVPFPSYDVFRLLPWHKDIIHGMLGSDLVGFHTYDYVNAFLESARVLNGYENRFGLIKLHGHTCTVRAFPIGIDFDRFSSYKSENVAHYRRKIAKIVGRKKLIFSISRLDYTKGIIEQLDAFRYFLGKNQEQVGNVLYVLVVVPSREHVEKYGHVKREIEMLVSEINSRYAKEGNTPVLYIYDTLSFSELIAFYKSADVMLNLPLRDGMNLVAKEYIASKDNLKGVLILSGNAGASKDMKEALIVNPYDLENISNAMEKALGLSGSYDYALNRSIRKRLLEGGVRKWAENFIGSLESSVKANSIKPKALDDEALRLIYRDISLDGKGLVILDYDGTLVPLCENPEEARPDAELLELLKGIAKRGHSVVLISGRKKADLERWFGGLHRISLVAEHGAYRKDPGAGRWEKTASFDTKWMGLVREIMEEYRARIDGSFIEQKENSLAWHYGKVKITGVEDTANEVYNTLTNITANSQVNVLFGKKVVEVSNMMSKGIYYELVLARTNPSFIFCAGDDITDESLFYVLPDGAISVKVGDGDSEAKYRCKSYKSLRNSMRRLFLK
jgi:trehalose 6-phosphate synthase/phosphatase